MRIHKFSVQGFRSLRDVTLDSLGSFNIFYGPNSSGKSNLLAAMSLFFDSLAQISVAPYQVLGARRVQLRPGRLTLQDFTRGHPKRAVQMEAQVLLPQGPLSGEPIRIRMGLEPIDREDPPTIVASILLFRGDSTDPIEMGDTEQSVLAALGSELHLVPAVRSLGAPIGQGASALDDAPITALLSEGHLERALLRALTDPDPRVRAGLDMLKKVLEGPPLRRPPFHPIFDPKRNQAGLQELKDARSEPTPVALEGLGVQQLYILLAGVLLSGASCVALEEPEAHLHAPSSGIQLRQLLVEVLDKSRVEQLFIATHSNLFDLDPDGYFDVRMDPLRGTVIERKGLSELDKHLYEPGPAKHALAEILRYLPTGAPVFRQPDGQLVDCKTMLEMLERDDPSAIAFLSDVHAAAVRAVQIRARKSQ